MKIKVLGPGCRNCVNLAANTQKALDALGIDADIEKVTEYADIAGYGIMSTPGLVIDEAVVSYGKVLSPSAIAELLRPLVAQ